MGLVLALGQKVSAMGRVLHVIHSGGFYGAERMLADHCLALSATLDSRVVFISPPQALLERFSAMGIACEAVGSLAELVRIVERYAQVVNAHNFRAQLYAWRAARQCRRPLVFTQHGFTPRNLKQRLYMYSSILLCKTPVVSHVVCVAGSIVRQHEKLHVPERKLSLIANGLPVGRTQPRQTFQPLIGFVGRLSREKGPDLFLQAVIPLLRQRPEARAVMLGDGPMRDGLQMEIDRQGLAGRITLAGYQEGMDAWLSRLSVLVISSRTEGTPMILLESMRAAVPVVAFAVGGIPDVMRHEQEGLLAAAEDCAALGRNIGRLLDEPRLADTLCRQARLRQQEQFSLHNTIRHWQALYTRLLGGQASC